MNAIRPAKPADALALGGLIATAFDHLGLSQWLVPDSAERMRVLPRYFGLLTEQAARHGTVDVASDGVGVAVWSPHPSHDMDSYDDLLETICGTHVDRFRALDHAMQVAQPVGTPYHHLMFLAVHPDHQNRGVGGALLGHHHDVLDREGVPGYLESASPASTRLYQRHGYVPVGEPFSPPGCHARLLPLWRSL